MLITLNKTILQPVCQQEVTNELRFGFEDKEVGILQDLKGIHASIEYCDPSSSAEVNLVVHVHFKQPESNIKNYIGRVTATFPRDNVTQHEVTYYTLSRMNQLSKHNGLGNVVHNYSGNSVLLSDLDGIMIKIARELCKACDPPYKFD